MSQTPEKVEAAERAGRFLEVPGRLHWGGDVSSGQDEEVTV